MQAHFLGDDLEVISVGEIVSTQTVVSGWSMYSEISLTGRRWSPSVGRCRCGHMDLSGGRGALAV
jgi:hypothetical protein